MVAATRSWRLTDARRGIAAAAVGAACWLVVVAVAVLIGRWLLGRGLHIVLPTPPVLGMRADAGWLRLAVVAGVGCALAVALPRVARTSPWRRVLIVTALGALVWWIAVALVDGPSGLVRGPSWPTEYLHDVPAVRADPGGFLRTFTADIERYEIHVRGHPPGFVLLLAAMDALGLGGPRWEAALVLGASATAPVAVLLCVRELAGERSARDAAPFLALAPAAIWIATSADALYMTVAAWAVALVVLATARRGTTSRVLAAGAGVAGGLALLGSYGMVLMAFVPAAVVWRRRRADVAVVATVAAAAVLVALVPFGFWWFDGLAATKREYEVLDIDRPYPAFLLINAGAWALALGPATAAGLARLRAVPARALVFGGVLAAAVANLSGLSEGEVERIWLPFGLWVLPAGAALRGVRGGPRPWLVVQVLTAVAVVGTIRTQW
jgi:hypothetical protein